MRIEQVITVSNKMGLKIGSRKMSVKKYYYFWFKNSRNANANE